MNRNKVLLLVLLLASLSLAACSGPITGTVCTVNCGGGNATLSVTMTDTPPVGSSILSFTVTITGASVTPSTGSAVNLTLTPNSPTIELTHLQSDSAFLGTSTLPSGNYTSALVAFSSPDIILINQTGAALSGATTPCPVNAVCEFKPIAVGAITLNAAPFPLTLNSNGQQGISLDFNLSNVITFANSTINVDFTQAKVLTASVLPRPGTPTGSLDLVEDFTGIITTLSGNNLTVQSGTKGTITAVADSNTAFNIDPTICAAQNLSCLGTNKTVSIDASLKPDGTMTLLEADLLDNVAVDEVEGIVTNVDLGGTGTIDIILSDKSVVSGNALLTVAPPGNVLAVTLGNAPLFSVDTKGLSAVTGSPAAINDFASVSNVSEGQVVRLQVTNVAAVPNSTFLTATTNSIVLRFSRVTATATSSLAGSFFNIDASTLPPYFAGNGNALVQISAGQTQIDGATDLTQIQGSTVSMRVLFIPNYLTSPFFAAKVRKH
jgi:hypothetical protein